MPPPPHLDHIILLVPYTTLLHPPSTLTTHFTLTPGGRHADNLTENKLIVFRDGSYIELIAFINDDPALRAGHWWGDKPFGIIDFAFTSPSGAAADFAGLEERLGEGAGFGVGVGRARYEKPVRGGRKRPDGVAVEWEVTFPDVSGSYVQRGLLPFFCHDVTPRAARVPLDEARVSHPCGAYGISQLVVFVPEEQVEPLAKVYEAVLGMPDKSVEGGVGNFIVGSVHGVIGTPDPRIVVKAPEEGWQKQRVKEEKFMIGNLKVARTGGDEAMVIRIEADGEYGMGGIFLESGAKGVRENSGPEASV